MGAYDVQGLASVEWDLNLALSFLSPANQEEISSNKIRI